MRYRPFVLKNPYSGATCLLLCCAVVLFGQICPELLCAAPTKPQQMKGAAAGDCSACHGAEKVLPANHVATATMDAKACSTCHRKGKSSLKGKIPADHTHRLNGVSCEKCHGSGGAPQPVMTEQCLTCHGTAESVAQKTSLVKPNPHNNPHLGTSLDCDLCHHQHAKSENYCSKCHMYKYVVP
jgi:hypothetical protein